ncbi:DUF4286 family protein [Xanthovirga aplysinae]|uniref:DUF4286 family protein n=1 Tax=Xanthovirga aplysinae TaxID=2529853 RepID=UPI0012BBCF85|nr:DUF4286 family protein [Xanthovirga aplysinae]MTI30524.1 DUF4286 family protein [Xanthovirga aplysinae]
MILYNVTVNIDPEVEEKWLNYMKNIHIPEVMKTGCFSEYKFFRLVSEGAQEGTNYAIMYYAPSMDQIDLYLEKYAEKLRQDHQEKFKDKMVAFRSLLESV